MSISIAHIGQEDGLADLRSPNRPTSFERVDRKSPTRCIGGSVEFASRHGDHSRDFRGERHLLELGPGAGVLN
ncbi:hypothetical protein GGE23_001335 [Rhizobium leguminosarum]|nr:hypothetical protein [Rhizobium leguminosarum]MBB4432202.1 hypothetical protein [Rhizobium esperanzae]MBB4307059.1 hypothetical protein [Rhizobium leguminosarum]MBB4417358.1 hypothetical protein [Rhizobium leguminosarum]MBB4528216.1 hypothetical protein [Rhizobium leguminosarum]